MFEDYPYMKPITDDRDGYQKISPHTLYSLRAYITYGQAGGDFLSNLICGNAFKAIAHADDDNLRAFDALVKFVGIRAPVCCYGTRLKYKIWVTIGGLENYAEYDKAIRGQKHTIPNYVIARLTNVFSEEASTDRGSMEQSREYIKSLARSVAHREPVGV